MGKGQFRGCILALYSKDLRTSVSTYKRKLFEIVHSAQSAFSTEIVLRIYLASVEVAS